MSNTALQGTDGGMVGGTTAAGAAPDMPLDPDNHNPVRGPELVQTAGRMNTIDMHMLAHKFRLDLIKWTPSQLPGTILGNWKNHPNIHPFTRFIGKKYLYWAGSFKLTFTICGSGLVGGRLRFIRLPPHISDEQIAKYTVNDLSYFDGFDLDPKSLLTIGIPFEDINRQKMHVMTQDLSHEDAFGSRILVIVYGQLQAQIGDNNGLSVIVEVEMLPDFVISTFVPDLTNTPFANYDGLNFGGTNYYMTYGNSLVTTVNTYPGAVRVAKTGFNLLRKTGGEPWWKENRDCIAFQRFLTQKAINIMTEKVNSRLVDSGETVAINNSTFGVPGEWVCAWSYDEDVAAMRHLQYDKSQDGFAPKEMFSKVPMIVVASQCWLYYNEQLEDEGSEFAPLNNERIMYFSVNFKRPSNSFPEQDLDTSYRALQCRELGFKLGQYDALDRNASIMMSVHDSASGIVLMYAKLYPEGILTTHPGSDALVLPNTVEFRFLSVGSRTDQIPAQTPAMRAETRAIMKETKRALRALRSE